LLLFKTATGAISEEYGYNPRGNLAQIKTGGTIARTFQWDGADRLIGATAGGTTLGMQYDVDGRRVQLSASGVITNYLWDTTTRYGDVLLESGSNGAFKTSYVLGSGELISQKRGANPREYYLLDGQGSVRGLTSDTGTLTQEYAYDTAGSLTSGDATKSAYLYTGQQYDAATELYSLRARYYSPQQGRFLSMDKWPVDFKTPIELNRYVYAVSNPVSYNDPSGYATFFEKVKTQFFASISYKSVSLALVTVVAVWLVQTVIWAVQLRSILASADKKECTVTGWDFFGYQDCTYYLSHAKTLELAEMLNSMANFWGTLGAPLFVGGLIAMIIPVVGVLGIAISTAGYVLGDDIGRVKDIVADLKVAAAQNNNQGKIWIQVPKDNVVHPKSMTFGNW
jgi:RHS repeat-associated protein